MSQPITIQQRALDLFERVGTTFLEALVVWLLAADQIDQLDVKIFLAAAIPACLNVVKVFLTSWMPTPSSWLLDMLVRSLWTFLLGVLGAATTGGFDIYNVSAWHAVVVGAGMAAGAVLKGLLAKKISNSITPASLAVPPAGERPMQPEKDKGVVVPDIIWWVVGILAAIALIIWIMQNVDTKDDAGALALCLCALVV